MGFVGFILFFCGCVRIYLCLITTRRQPVSIRKCDALLNAIFHCYWFVHTPNHRHEPSWWDVFVPFILSPIYMRLLSLKRATPRRRLWCSFAFPLIRISDVRAGVPFFYFGAALHSPTKTPPHQNTLFVQTHIMIDAFSYSEKTIDAVVLYLSKRGKMKYEIRAINWTAASSPPNLSEWLMTVVIHSYGGWGGDEWMMR